MTSYVYLHTPSDRDDADVTIRTANGTIVETLGTVDGSYGMFDRVDALLARHGWRVDGEETRYTSPWEEFPFPSMFVGYTAPVVKL